MSGRYLHRPRGMRGGIALASALLLGIAVTPSPALAQRAAPSGAGTRAGNFVIEAGAGALGSLVGIGIVGLASSCGVEDLACIITTVGAGGVLGAVGATVGVSIAARHTGAPHSLIGAALGAVVGTGAGLGIHWLLNRSSDRNLGDAVVVPIFVVAQGVGAAVGGRAGGR